MNTEKQLTPRSKTIWLLPDANCNAFEHKIDDDSCTCEVCKDKPRLILLIH